MLLFMDTVSTLCSYLAAPGLSQLMTGHRSVNGPWTPGTAGAWPRRHTKKKNTRCKFLNGWISHWVSSRDSAQSMHLRYKF